LGILTDLIQSLPLYLLSLPVMLMALSIHESAHGYAAYKLGDPTAHSLGRITLNPVKHFDLLGFLSMLVFHIGWAKPVPINARYFKKPRRDMAITGAAGPLSNLCLALIHLVVLRLAMILVANTYAEESFAFARAYNSGEEFVGTMGFTVVSLILYVLYLGVIMNVMFAIFNLIPIPPFDGSRIFYAFLPPKWYWGVMKYERVIMLVFIVLFFLGFLSGPLTLIENAILDGLLYVTGMGEMTLPRVVLDNMYVYVHTLLSIRF
jgi:Zn-dependent protease